MRDITALEKTETYSNKIAKEMTPGLIKPLDWSVVVPIKSKMWINVISQVIGDNDIDPNSLAKLFNYRAYHNLSVFGRIFESLGLPRESLDVMMGVAPPGAGKPPFRPRPRLILLSPRIVRFLWDKWTYAKKAQRDYLLLCAEAKWYSNNLHDDLDESELVRVIDQLKNLNLRTTTHTFHAILLMQIYSGFLRSLLQRKGIDFADFNLGADMPELDAYNPNKRLAELHRHYLELDKEAQAIIASGDYLRLQKMIGIAAFQSEFRDFIHEFGHMSDRTVLFDSVPWRETPGLILELISNFEPPKERNQERNRFEEVRGRGFRGWMLKVFYDRARQFYLLREQYSSLYTYTLMLFRVYYLTIGARMAAQGLLDSQDDIYYLYDEEIRAYVMDKRRGKLFRSAVRERKDEIDRCKDAIMPAIVYGESPPPVVVQHDQKLSGTPTSRGYYTGPVKLVRGINDFNKVNNGDVLVIPFSEVGWLPLFAKAGAVVAESGGMLSHSSIVAREYGIPAVVSVNGALYLQDNQIISIDGYKGEVFVHSYEQGSAEIWE
jgi:pyruvate,water dikinase